jgi:DNA-binding MarR family transcriptional regulator
MAVLLTVHLTDGPHTVRGLAAELNVSKPAITRALDRLGQFELARCKVDPVDRRSVLVQQTRNGSAFLRDVSQIMARAERDYAAARPSERTAATASKPKARGVSQAPSR